VRARVHVTEGATLLLNVRNVTERLPRITNQRRRSVTVYHSIYVPLTRLHSSSLASLRYTTRTVSRCSTRCVQRLSVRTASSLTDRQQHSQWSYCLLAEPTEWRYICVPPRTRWTTGL